MGKGKDLDLDDNIEVDDDKDLNLDLDDDIEIDDSGLSVDFVYGGGINGGGVQMNGLDVIYIMDMSTPTNIDYIPYRVSDGIAISTMSLLTIEDLPGGVMRNREELFAVNDTVFVICGEIPI